MRVIYKTKNGAAEVRTGYRKSHHFRAYEEPKDDRNFIEFLINKGYVDEARLLASFNNQHYGNQNNRNISFLQDALTRVTPTTAENHTEIDDYLLSDYVQCMITNPEALLVAYQTHYGIGQPESQVPGVTYQKVKGSPLHSFQHGRLKLSKKVGPKQSKAWKFTRFFEGGRHVELFFATQSEAEEYAKYYADHVYSKLCLGVN